MRDAQLACKLVLYQLEGLPAGADPAADSRTRCLRHPRSLPGWPQTDTRLPARVRDLALRLALRKGVPASPLRSYPGTPSSTHYITDVLVGPGAERGRGASGQQGGSGEQRQGGWEASVSRGRRGRTDVGRRRGCVWWRAEGPVGASRGWHYVGDGGRWAGAGVGVAGADRAGKSAVAEVGRRLVGERRGVAGRGCFLVRW